MDQASDSGLRAPRRSRVRQPPRPGMTQRVHCSRRAYATPNAGAVRVRDTALATAERFGLDVPPPEDEPDSEVVTPGVLTAGERLVTSMLADVRGYTPIAAASAPEDSPTA